MKSLGNDISNLSDNMHSRGKICLEFYHDIVYMRHIRIVV